MIVASPDKWVRKAVHTAINNMVVESVPIPCYDVNTETGYKGRFYVLMSTQNKNQTFNKCSKGWDYFILLDIVTRYGKNTGSRLMADNIEQEIINRLENLVLENNLTIHRTEITGEPDLATKTDSEVIHRKFLRYNFTIK